MAKLMLADLFWEAANVMLPDGARYEHPHSSSPYSCDACRSAAYEWALPAWQVSKRCAVLFIEMGMPDPLDNYDAFEDFEEGQDRQGVRYMWLLLAMHVAQDEGIEV